MGVFTYNSWGAGLEKMKSRRGHSKLSPEGGEEAFSPNSTYSITQPRGNNMLHGVGYRQIEGNGSDAEHVEGQSTSENVGKCRPTDTTPKIARCEHLKKRGRGVVGITSYASE